MSENILEVKNLEVGFDTFAGQVQALSLIHISEPTRPY